MKKLFAYILFFLCLFSCQLRPTRKAKKTFREHGFCYDGKPTGLERQLSLDGYYDYDVYPKVDTVSHMYSSSIAFLKDGRYVGDMFVKKTGYDNVEWESAGPFFIGSADVGTYQISGDTIKVGYIYTTFAPWSKEEKWYRIIDDKTIELIGYAENYERVAEADQTNYKGNYIGRKYHFVPFDPMPDFNNSWILKKKWFWCDKAAYETWKASQIQKGEW